MTSKLMKIAIFTLGTLAATIWIVNGATYVKQRLDAINGGGAVLTQPVDTDK